MRTVFLTVALMGCTQVTADPSDADEWRVSKGLDAAPPPGGLSLSLRGTGELGTVLTVELAGGLAYEEVLILRGSGGLGEGSCPASLGGQCLGLLPPVEIPRSEWVDVTGSGTDGVPVASAPGLDGVEWCFQGVAVRSGGPSAELSTTACTTLDRDADGDGVLDDADLCPGGDDGFDDDGDGVPNDCDPCPLDALDDSDGDGACDSDDPCPLDDPDDSDGNGVCDSDDPCVGFDDDSDGDGACDLEDPCPLDAFDLCIEPRTWSGDIEGGAEGHEFGPTPLTLTVEPDDRVWGTFAYHGDSVCMYGTVTDGGQIEGALGPDSGTCSSLSKSPGSYTPWTATFDGDTLTGSIDYSSGLDPVETFPRFDTKYHDLPAEFALIRDLCAADSDGDGLCDGEDLCVGDDASGDADGDGVCDSDDLCPGGDDTLDADSDGTPDSCDPCPADPSDDTDGDGACDSDDPCPLDAGDDSDGDGVCDTDDLCPGTPDIDTDGDGALDCSDPCPLDPSDDVDGDGVCDGDDLCDGDDASGDSDGDGVCDSDDPCVGVDSDGDGTCDVADPCPDDAVDLCRNPGTWSGDIVGESKLIGEPPLDPPDPFGPTALTLTVELDGGVWGTFAFRGESVCLYGDVVDGDQVEGGVVVGDDTHCASQAGIAAPYLPWTGSFDGDTLTGSVAYDAGADPDFGTFLPLLVDVLDATFTLGRDLCPLVDDSDGDGICDDDDPCVGDNASGDTDADGLCDSDDPCPGFDDDVDTDGDGVCDVDDPCPLDATDDTDGDGVCDGDDPCPLDAGDDTDGDGVCDGDDPCPTDALDKDSDGDTVCDIDDPCPLDAADDSDGDGACDSDDPCPDDALDVCAYVGTWTGDIEGQVLVDAGPIDIPTPFSTPLTLEVDSTGGVWGTFVTFNPVSGVVVVCMHGSIVGAGEADGAIANDDVDCDLLAGVAGDRTTWSALFSGDTATGGLFDDLADGFAPILLIEGVFSLDRDL